MPLPEIEEAMESVGNDPMEFENKSKIDEK